MKGIRTFLAVVLLLPAGWLAANTYTVTSTADSGAGTLRQAILDANANPGTDSIAFAIVGSGVQTIVPVTLLPTVTETATIDGYTQPGSSPNTLGPGFGSDAVLKIEISGAALPQTNASDCLKITGPGVTVKGLVIHSCFDDHIELTGSADGAVIVGNFIGLDPTGTLSGSAGVRGIRGATVDNVVVGGTAPADRNVIAGGSNQMVNAGTAWQIQGNVIGLNAAGTARPAGHGVTSRCIDAGTNDQIGGTTPAARNVISGCDVSAILTGAGNVIQGNFIGTDASGTHPIANKHGIQNNGNNVTIGGSAPGAGNVIAASFGGPDGGISVLGDNAIIQGNFIGTDATGTIDFGNAPYGIVVRGDGARIGGIGPGEGNIIAFNGAGTYHAGVYITSTASGNSIRGNRIFANQVFGIDIAFGPSVGPAPVDELDADSGPNGVQNFPFVDSVDYGASTTVHGRLTSAASTVFDIDFYAGPACAPRPPLYPQGEEYVGSTQVTTDAAGHGTFDAVLDTVLAAGQPVTAVATDPAGNSSEFSNDILFLRSYGGGPAAGGTTNSLIGHRFEAGATVTVGGVPAANVVVLDASHIQANMPVLPPGSINDITVQNPGGSSGTRPNGWVADFNDAAIGLTFLSDVYRLVANEITVGIGGGNYGFLDNIKRQQMAVFLLKAKHGICYTPPPCAGLFPDVPCSSTFAPWIEAMANEGITGGCGGGLFCPVNPVRRDQMAVFLLKAHRGSSFVPPACTGHFADVVCPSTFANWIEELSAEGVTSGCGGGNYCPSNNNTRGQMATFLSKTFGLQAP